MTADFSRQQLEDLDRCLEDFCAQSGAELALLADETGQTIASCGQTHSGDFSTLAALAAANLAATVAIAGQVGERGSCRSMLYEGEHKRIYIAAVPQELVLLVVAGSHVPIGAVRFFLQQARQNIEEVLRSLPVGIEEEPLLGKDFDLESGFDQLFATGLGMMEGSSDENE